MVWETAYVVAGLLVFMGKVQGGCQWSCRWAGWLLVNWVHCSGAMGYGLIWVRFWVEKKSSEMSMLKSALCVVMTVR